MAWSEVSPSLWQRTLGENERLIRLFGLLGRPYGRDHWSLNVSASFRGGRSWEGEDHLERKLRNGWLAFRFQHPSIATWVNGDHQLEYETGTIEILEKWVEETFVIVDKDLSLDEVAATQVPLSDLLILLYLPRRSEVLLHTPHWRTDGPGALQLLNAFFEAVTSPAARDPLDLPWGEEHARLAPSVEEALRLPIEATIKTQATVEEIFDQMARMGPGVGVQCRGDAAAVPSATRNARLRLSESLTKQILAACQHREISVTAAVHASVAMINYLAAPPERKGYEYKSTLRFSLRPYLPPPYNSSAYASGLYTSGVIASVPSTHSWIECAKQYHARYQDGVSMEFVRARRHYAQRARELVSRTAGHPGLMPCEIDVSTVENASDMVRTVYEGGDGAMEITRISLGIETDTRISYVFFWIYRRQLELNLVYNEAFHDAQSMEALVNRLAEILQLELQLQS